MGVTNNLDVALSGDLGFSFLAYFGLLFAHGLNNCASENISFHMTVSGLSDAHVVMHDSGRSMLFYTKRRNFILGVGMGIGSNAGLILSFSLSMCLPLFCLPFQFGFNKVECQMDL